MHSTECMCCCFFCCHAPRVCKSALWCVIRACVSLCACVGDHSLPLRVPKWSPGRGPLPDCRVQGVRGAGEQGRYGCVCAVCVSHPSRWPRPVSADPHAHSPLMSERLLVWCSMLGSGGACGCARGPRRRWWAGWRRAALTGFPTRLVASARLSTRSRALAETARHSGRGGDTRDPELLLLF